MGELSELCTQIGLTCLYFGKNWKIRFTLDSELLDDISHKSGTERAICDSHVSSFTFMTHPTTDSVATLGIKQQTANFDYSKTPMSAGNLTVSKSNSGGVVLKFGSHTFVPFSWTQKKHRAVSDSSTEAEIISLDTGLRMEGMPALNLWDRVIDISFPNCRWFQACSSHTNTKHIMIHLEILIMYLKYAPFFSMRTALIHLRRQRSCNKDRETKSEFVQCVIHHAHIVSTWIVFMTAWIEIQRFRSTTSTQHSIWQTFSQKDHSQETDGQNWHYWSTSWRTPHWLKATCQSLLRLWILYFPSMSKRAGESFAASASAKQKPVHCTAMPTWTVTQYFHQITKLEATLSVKTCVSKIFKHSPWRLEHYHDPRWW